MTTEPTDPNTMVVAAIGAEMRERRKEKRVRDAYICFWANRTSRDKLDAAAAERGISRSEMARIVFGYGLAAMGIK